MQKDGAALRRCLSTSKPELRGILLARGGDVGPLGCSMDEAER